MKSRKGTPALVLLALGCLTLPADAADRVRAGQWSGTTVTGGRTFPTSSCISKADADALNGDANAVRGYLQSIIPSSICAISDVRAQGDQIVYVATCSGQPAKTITTSYRGDSSEGTDTGGGKTAARRVGTCT